MNILVTGLNGFVGQEVKTAFERSGHQVYPASKDILLLGGIGLDKAVRKADVIVNLAGANIVGRWTEDRMVEILESRRVSTRNLVKAVNASEKKPILFINASATGIYQPDVFCDDTSSDYADNFLSRVVRAWEEELYGLQQVRKVILRFGVVIGENGGMLRKLMPWVKKRIRIILGSGEQEFPLIHVEDVTGFMLYVLSHPEMEGVYNLVIPNCVNYREFVKALAVYKRPLLSFSVPEWLLWLLLGDSHIVITRSAHVVPWRLMHCGYALKYRTIHEVVGRA